MIVGLALGLIPGIDNFSVSPTRFQAGLTLRPSSILAGSRWGS